MSVIELKDMLLKAGTIRIPGFEAKPKRWTVERTLRWFDLFRRLSKEYH